MLSVANWVLSLIELKGEIEEATSLTFSTADNTSFQKKVVETFITDLRTTLPAGLAPKIHCF